MLTPALRVAEAPDEVAAETAVDAAVPESADATGADAAEAAADWHPEDEDVPLAGLDATANAMAARDTIVITAANTAANTAADMVVDDWQPEAEAQGDAVEVDGPAMSAAPRSPGFDVAALESTIAELEAAVAARSEDWDPDGSEEPAPGDLTRPVSRSAPRRAPEPEPAVASEPMPVPDPEERADPSSEALAEPEPESAAAVERPQDEPPPAEPSPAASSPATSSLATPDAEPAPEGGDTTDDKAEDPALFDDDVDDGLVLDEEALHEMVRDMIRQELQGALGERITRNVRKLVRAEINRALASRDFD